MLLPSSGSKVSQVRRRMQASAACYLLPAGIFLGLHFDHEDGGDMFLLMSAFSQITRRYNPEHGTLQKASTLNVTTLIKGW
jgi:hypothetical protein